jgi:anti-anti-sigma factor
LSRPAPAGNFLADWRFVGTTFVLGKHLDGGLAMDGFAVTVDAEGPQTVIALAGEVDLDHAGDVRSLGVMAVQAPDVSEVVFDLSAVTFVDSSGIGALIDVRSAAEDVGVKVRIDRASKAVARVLAITGVAAMFGVIEADEHRTHAGRERDYSPAAMPVATPETQ